MTIRCPQCNRRLQVPDNTIGRRARCPACRAKFIIADPNDALQQTVTGFVMEDQGGESKPKK